MNSLECKVVFYWDQLAWVAWDFYVFYWESTVFGWFSALATRLKWLKTMGIDRCVMSTNAILINAIGVCCSLSPGIRPCFQLFQLKTVEMSSIGTLQPHQPKPV